MNNLRSLITKHWATYPNELKTFLFRILIITLIWKFSYHLLLKPKKIIDKPLTNITASACTAFLNTFYRDTITSDKNSLVAKNEYYTAYLVMKGKKIIGIADPCNGLELFTLYSLFLICIPPFKIKRFVVFLITGVCIVFILNVLRCCAMFWLSYTQNSFFDFAHHYLFKIIVYLAIFMGWVLYARKSNYEQ